MKITGYREQDSQKMHLHLFLSFSNLKDSGCSHVCLYFSFPLHYVGSLVCVKGDGATRRQKHFVSVIA